MTEAWLAFFHISAFLAWVVFASSQAALCRVEWLNEAVVHRLARLDRILWIATAAVLLSGLARMVWGVKGLGWYASHPLLHLKLTLFVVAALLMLGCSRKIVRWRQTMAQQGALPSPTDIRNARKLIMLETHLVALIPLVAVFLARGWGN